MGFPESVLTVMKLDGSKIPDVRGVVSRDSILIRRRDLPIVEGDTLVRTLENGIVEEYLALDVHDYAMGPFPFQIKVQKKKSLLHRNPPPTVINQIGDNARVNINSNDNSINTVNNYDSTKFEEIKKILATHIADQEEKTNCEKSLNELQKSIGKSTYTEKYKEFIEVVSKHVEIIAPFIPYLTQLIPK